jgi:hypothetical protein
LAARPAGFLPAGWMEEDVSMAQRPDYRRCRTGGFGLVELMAAFAVVVIGILGVAASIATALQNQSTSIDRTYVFRELANQLEVIGRTDFAAIESTYNGMSIPLYRDGLDKETAGGTLEYLGQARVLVQVIDADHLAVTVSATVDGETIQLYQEFAE